MNVETMKVPIPEARKQLREYRAALHRRADSEYETIVTAYEAMARGLPVLRLSHAIGNAPRDEQGRPKLAIARADRKQVRVHASAWGSVWTFWANTSGRGRRPEGASIEVAHQHEPRNLNGWALVPMVPPSVHGRHDLTKHFILWEVEQWADKPIIAQPDRDPYLLRMLGGDLYAVIAAWDLSDIERAVMADRRFSA